MRIIVSLLVIMMLAIGACSDDSSPDAGVDAVVEAGTDAVVEAAPADAGVEAAPVDAAGEQPADVGTDQGEDQ